MRLAVARDDGLDEDRLEAAIERGVGLTDAQQAAVDFCDALVSQPGAIGADLASTLRAHWTGAQIVEHALDVMKWSYQKVAVALGADPALADGELTDLVFDSDGNWRR